MIKKLLILLIVPFATLSAQQVNNVKLTVEGDKVVVTYDIDDYSNRYLYDVSITFQSTTKITPFALSGDVGKDLTGGKNKKIVWDIYQDIDGLSGNLRAEVVVTPGTFLKGMGRAGNAFRSLLLPGWGDYYVMKRRWHPIVVHTLFAWSATSYFILDDLCKRKFNEYKSATTQNEMDMFYNQYKDDVTVKNYILVGLASLYAYDFSVCFINGLMNKKGHPYFDKSYKKEKLNASLILIPSPYSAKGAQLSLLVNF